MIGIPLSNLESQTRGGVGTGGRGDLLLSPQHSVQGRVASGGHLLRARHGIIRNVSKVESHRKGRMNLRSLFQNAEGVQEFQAGAAIFAQGDPVDVMYVILDGDLEIRTESGVVDATGSGDIVGEMALIDSEPRSATVVAKSDCRLAPVDKKRFLFHGSGNTVFRTARHAGTITQVAKMSSMLVPWYTHHQ